MHRNDVVDILSKIPPNDISKTILVLKFGAAITLDLIIRYEEDYVIVRGRESGTNDDGRGFFVPFEEIIFVKIDRLVTMNEIKRMYGERVADTEEPLLKAEVANDAKTDAPKTLPGSPVMDPGVIAKQNLLARIRAARTSMGASQS